MRTVGILVGMPPRRMPRPIALPTVNRSLMARFPAHQLDNLLIRSSGSEPCSMTVQYFHLRHLIYDM
ncbi:MAG: hypothetical protein OJF50_001585 [Nitrospira sp.]|jgi:hypothetical protein|nr:hypothetical protein [Nitrospira sp.]